MNNTRTALHVGPLYCYKLTNRDVQGRLEAEIITPHRHGLGRAIVDTSGRPATGDRCVCFSGGTGRTGSQSQWSRGERLNMRRASACVTLGLTEGQPVDRIG